MDLRGLFDGLYDKLVLRDLFGKVVPGSAFLLYIFSALLGLDTVDRLLNKMTVTLWVIAIGFAWLLAFALQFLGESCGMLKTHPPISGKPKADEQTGRNDFYKMWASFHKLAEPHERVYAERLSVIKEACGNGAVSIAFITLGLILELFVSLIRGKGAWYPLLPFSGLAAVLSISLWRMHIKHVNRYGDFVQKTIERGDREDKSRERSS